MTSKYLTDEVKAAIEAVKNYEAVDPRFERLKHIWKGSLRKQIEEGMSQKTAFAIVGKAVANGEKLEFSTFSKMLGKLAAKTKRRQTAAQKGEAAAAAMAVAQTATARAAKRASKKAETALSPTETSAHSSGLESDPFAPPKDPTKG